MEKKAILFDLDDTLYEYEKTHKIALDRVYNRFNTKFKITKSKFFYLYNMSKKEVHMELSQAQHLHIIELYISKD